MTELTVRVELSAQADPRLPERLASRLRDTFSMRIPVETAAAGMLPRYEFKARRWRKMASSGVVEEEASHAAH